MNQAFDKILEKLEELQNNLLSQTEGNIDLQVGVINGVMYSRKTVQELAEEYNGGWIPCSKGLPKVNEKVLTTHENGMVQFATFTKNKNFVINYSDGDLYIIPVIAWQPLPEPYKERD